MHQAVLLNRTYIRYAARNTVEVIAMEELDRALREKSRHVGTYRAKDAYGEEVELMVHFPNLTLDQLESLSNSRAINYMGSAGRIPYTAIVNPHDLKEMEGIQGTRTPRELMGAIDRHRKVLAVRYGRGIDRDLWNRVSEGQVQIDLKLATNDLAGALGVHRHLAKITIRQPEALKRRVQAALEIILEDAARRLDELEGAVGKGEGARVAKELDGLARLLQDTPLQERAAQLLAKTNAK